MKNLWEGTIMTRKNRKILCLFLSVISFLNTNAKKSIVIDKNLNRRLIKYKRRNKQFSKSKNGNILLGAGLFVSVLTIGGITYLVKSVYSGSKKEIELLPVKNEETNKNHKSSKKEENIVEEYEKINLSSDDEKFISDNFFLIGRFNNSCTNDVFVQYLMCPNIRKKHKDCGSEKIRNAIGWIIEKRKEKFDGYCLERKLEIPKDIRPIPDSLEGICGNNFEIAQIPEVSFGCKYNGKSLGEGTKKNVGLGFFNHPPQYFLAPRILSKFVDALEGGNAENYRLIIDSSQERTSWDAEKIFSLVKGKNYYPTYIVIGGGHIYCYYVIYNKNKEVNYLLEMDGNNEQIKVFSKNQFLKKLLQRKGNPATSLISKIPQIMVIYSRGDIVEKYYVPDSQ